ncbi:hypothetical protein COJ67_10920 [Bacillus thuringiensis]|nr:hypothetical protein COJ67_10920 [Bacillus thuringiensis]PGX92623.1 hypothetical protein COE41_27205 [Bacillus thuringiensis]
MTSLFVFGKSYIYMSINEIILTVFQIYLSQLAIYQRFFKYIYHNLQYINDSTKDIDLTTKIDNNIPPCHTRKLLKWIRYFLLKCYYKHIPFKGRWLLFH